MASVSPRGFDNMCVAYKTSYDLIFSGETELFYVYAFTILLYYFINMFENICFVGWMLMDFHFIISSHFKGMTAIIPMYELGQENVQPIKRPR